MPFPKLGPHRLCVPCVQTCDHGSPSSQEVPTEAVVECGEEASQREMACKAEVRKEKMSSLLQAVRRKGEKQPRPQQPTPPIPHRTHSNSYPLQICHSLLARLFDKNWSVVWTVFANVCYVACSAGELCMYLGNCTRVCICKHTYVRTHGNSISCTVQ